MRRALQTFVGLTFFFSCGQQPSFVNKSDTTSGSQDQTAKNGASTTPGTPGRDTVLNKPAFTNNQGKTGPDGNPEVLATPGGGAPGAAAPGTPGATPGSPAVPSVVMFPTGPAPGGGAPGSTPAPGTPGSPGLPTPRAPTPAAPTPAAPTPAAPTPAAPTPAAPGVTPAAPHPTTPVMPVPALPQPTAQVPTTPAPAPPGRVPVVPAEPVPPPAAPAKQTCDVFIHLHGHHPEWAEVFIPARPLRNGMKDPKGKGVWGAGWPLPAALDDGGVVYNVKTGSQPGSADCQAFYSENYSPLVIDLTGNGIMLTPPDAGVAFDIAGDGVKQPIAWPSNPGSVMFLMLDGDGDNDVDSVNQLFGNNTVGPDGKTAANGFEALRKYDANGDGVIDARDPVFRRLRLWSDKNMDGRVDTGETYSLAEMGVVAIDLNYVNRTESGDAFGDETRQRSVVRMANGQWQRVFDLWFVPGIGD